MKPVEITGQGRFGRGRTFVTRRDGACGTFDPEVGPNAKMPDAPKAPDRIEMPVHWKGVTMPTLYRVFAKGHRPLRYLARRGHVQPGCRVRSWPRSRFSRHVCA